MNSFLCVSVAWQTRFRTKFFFSRLRRKHIGQNTSFFSTLIAALRTLYRTTRGSIARWAIEQSPVQHFSVTLAFSSKKYFKHFSLLFLFSFELTQKASFIFYYKQIEKSLIFFFEANMKVWWHKISGNNLNFRLQAFSLVVRNRSSFIGPKYFQFTNHNLIRWFIWILRRKSDAHNIKISLKVTKIHSVRGRP